ncbi:MAG: hypothetical protein R3301_07750 [Saprospiraceae bacterium]|nr:hypothetical protein [Saprospiraceae bacterium]
MSKGRRLSVIDLGTNTFHLLLVEVRDGGWTFLFRKRIFVNLAEDSIDHIGDAAWSRGMAALAEFALLIRQYDIENVRAVGTEALRRADNAVTFLREVKDRFSLEVQVVDGDQEAAWIAAGVMAAMADQKGTYLVMDIGGGSVEFILIQHGNIRFSQSYPIGVAVLYERFHDTEPISQQALSAMDAFLTSQLRDLLNLLEQYPDCALVGASGTFEVIEAIVSEHPGSAPISMFQPAAFQPIYQRLLGQDLAARLADPAIPPSRARYLVVAMHLVAFVLNRVHNDLAFISAYAMKEGIITEMIENLDKAKQ